MFPCKITKLGARPSPLIRQKFCSRQKMPGLIKWRTYFAALWSVSLFRRYSKGGFSLEIVYIVSQEYTCKLRGSHLISWSYTCLKFWSSYMKLLHCLLSSYFIMVLIVIHNFYQFTVETVSSISPEKSKFLDLSGFSNN